MRRSPSRQAIRFNTQEAAQKEWLTPVLFLRSHEKTHLFPGTTANPLDFTGDAKPAKELSRQIDQIQPAPRAGGLHEAVLTIRRRLDQDHDVFDLRLEAAGRREEAMIALPAKYTAAVKIPGGIPGGRGIERDERRPEDSDHLRVMGVELFSILFPGELETLLRAAQNEARWGPGLRLSLVANDPALDLVPGSSSSTRGRNGSFCSRGPNPHFCGRSRRVVRHPPRSTVRCESFSSPANRATV